MKGGPKGDQKGIKKGTQNSSYSKIEKRLHVEVCQKLNIDEEKTMSTASVKVRNYGLGPHADQTDEMVHI